VRRKQMRHVLFTSPEVVKVGGGGIWRAGLGRAGWTEWVEEVVLADCAVLRRCPLIPALGSPACLPAPPPPCCRLARM